MNHKLPISEKISKAVYAMGRFDAIHPKDSRAINVFLSYLDDQTKMRALKVCVEEFQQDEDSSKAYDRGYVRGLYEMIHFIQKSYAEADKAQVKEDK